MNSPRPTVILGAAGQVGHEVVEQAKTRQRPFRALSRAECDLLDDQAISIAVRGAGCVINCAAYTAVDKAESEFELAARINSHAPGVLARACKNEGAVLLHISTDYVFNGTGVRPWRETDSVDPISAYGRTKAAGEENVRENLIEHVILRTAWVFGAQGRNFVKTMRYLASTRNEISVVQDQVGGPTPASAIAAALWAIDDQIREGNRAFGTYHFCGAPAASWYDFACAILADRSEVRVKPISTDEFPTAAVRPRNSVLDCTKIWNAYRIGQPDWHRALSSLG